MQTSSSGDIISILREYTEELPKEIRSPAEEDLLLLVEPVDFKRNIIFSPGVTIYKAIYGRGKTYGIGYYTVHYCERVKECSAIYINVRRMHEVINSEVSRNPSDPLLSSIVKSGTVRLDLELLYTIVTILSGKYKNMFEVGDVVSTTDLRNVNLQIIDSIRRDVMGVEDSLKLSRLFESLVENLVLKNHISPKLILILDEFEGIIDDWYLRLEEVKNYILSILYSLRSSKGGVLEKYPNTFTLIMTIQELAYPSQVMREFRRSAAPILGKILSVEDDLSIPIKFSLYDCDSIKEYYEKAIKLLSQKGLISKHEEERLAQISGCISYYFSPLLKMPARLFFEILRNIVSQVVLRKNEILSRINTPNNGQSVCDNVKKILEEIRLKVAGAGIYGLYASKEVTGITKDKIFSMLKKLAIELENSAGTYISEIRANGYEGIVVPYAGSKRAATIILYKGRNVKLGETKYHQGFLKHYGSILTNFCGYAKGNKDDECKIIIVHPEEVNIIGMVNVIQEIQQIGSTRIQKRVIDVPLDRDELAALYINSPSTDSTNQLSFLGGDMQYYEQRFKEVIHRIKMQVQKEVSPK
jgi:predicted transcriptional regulator